MNLKMEDLSQPTDVTKSKSLNTLDTLALENPTNQSDFKNSDVDTPTSKKQSKGKTNPWGVFVLGSTFLLMMVAAYLFFYLNSDFTSFHEERLNSTWGYPFLVLAIGLLIFKASFFIYTLYRYFCYKPIASVTDSELPTCTVIVPAYNEGKQVWETLMSLANSDYPEEKLQLLAIDDGSKDDT